MLFALILCCCHALFSSRNQRVIVVSPKDIKQGYNTYNPYSISQQSSSSSYMGSSSSFSIPQKTSGFGASSVSEIPLSGTPTMQTFSEIADRESEARSSLVSRKKANRLGTEDGDDESQSIRPSSASSIRPEVLEKESFENLNPSFNSEQQKKKAAELKKKVFDELGLDDF